MSNLKEVVKVLEEGNEIQEDNSYYLKQLHTTSKMQLDAFLKAFKIETDEKRIQSALEREKHLRDKRTDENLKKTNKGISNITGIQGIIDLVMQSGLVALGAGLMIMTQLASLGKDPQYQKTRDLIPSMRENMLGFFGTIFASWKLTGTFFGLFDNLNNFITKRIPLIGSIIFTFQKTFIGIYRFLNGVTFGLLQIPVDAFNKTIKGLGKLSGVILSLDLAVSVAVEMYKKAMDGGTIVDILKTIPVTMIEWTKDLIFTTLKDLGHVFSWVGGKIIDILNLESEFEWLSNIEILGVRLGNVFNKENYMDIVGKIESFTNGFLSMIADAYNVAEDFFDSVGDGIKTITDSIKRKFDESWIGIIFNTVTKFIDNFKSVFFDVIKGTMIDIWNNAKKLLPDWVKLPEGNLFSKDTETPEIEKPKPERTEKPKPSDSRVVSESVDEKKKTEMKVTVSPTVVQPVSISNSNAAINQQGILFPHISPRPMYDPAFKGSY